MKLAISTSSMRRMAWKQCRSCSPDSSSMCRDSLASRALSGWMRSPLASSRRVTGSCASQSTSRSGMQLAQLARDGDVAAPVPEADRRGEIERLLGLARRSGRLLAGRGNAEPAIEEIVDQRRCTWPGMRPSGLWPPPAMVTSSAPVMLGHGLRARIGLDLVVVAMDHQQRAADLAIHRLADVERRRDRACLHRLDQHGTGGVARPIDAVLDLLGRMRLGADVADEVLGEIGIVRQPVLAVVFVPALEPFAPGQEMLRRQIGIGRVRWSPTVPTRIAAFTRSG